MESLNNKSLQVKYRADSIALNICNNNLDIKFLKESYSSVDQGFHFITVIDNNIEQFIQDNSNNEKYMTNILSNNIFEIFSINNQDKKDKVENIQDIIDTNKLGKHCYNLLNEKLNKNPIIFSFINEYRTNIDIKPLIYIEKVELIDDTPIILEEESYEEKRKNNQKVKITSEKD